jgi:hypothetical protein
MNPGDIFIDVNGDANWGTPITGAPGVQYGTVNNSMFHYDYVIHFTGVGGTYLNYDVYQITDASLLEVKYFQNDASNPWRYKDDGSGSLIGSGSAEFVSGLTDGQTGFLGDSTPGVGTHNTLSLDLNLPESALDGSLLFHYTYECGNDNLIGRVSEGGNTMILFGGALFILALSSPRPERRIACR